MKNYIFIGVLLGHFFMILSGVSYSFSWILNYGGFDSNYSPLAGLLISASLLTGIIGIILLSNCIFTLYNSVATGTFIKPGLILLSGMIFFFIALIVTTVAFKRFLTSELILISIWTTLETIVILVLYKSRWLSKLQSVLSFILVIISALIGLFCYTIHYGLSGYIQFVNGLIPYFVISIFNIIIILLLLLKRLTGNENSVSKGS